MKTPVGIALGIAGLCTLVGCATQPPLVLDQPVGPITLSTPTNTGHLIVYTLSYPEGDDGGNEILVHSSYAITTPDGALVQKVGNQAGFLSEDASSVQLPPGEYRITAQAAGVSGLVTLPVVVQKNLTTVVDLNGEWYPDHSAGTHAVKLPNGRVIGAAAD